MSSDQRVRSPRLSCGTPKRSQMTRTGSGLAKRSMKSSSRPGPRSSISSSTSDAIQPRMRSTARGRKAYSTSLRSRVWRGGSVNTIQRVRTSNVVLCGPVSPPARRRSKYGLTRSEDRRESRKAARTSS